MSVFIGYPSFMAYQMMKGKKGILKPDAQIASGGSKSSLNIASYSANFTKMAFKNLAIYDGKNLSKDDCIKAYNYLQSLKAK